MTFKPKPCKCGGWHSSLVCPLKKRKPLQAKKRLRKVGKIGKRLLDQRAQFFLEHDPPYICVYCLVIGYENILMPEWVNVEHGESKARRPDKRFEKTNLYVGCSFHNREKGSMGIDEYIKKLKETSR